MSTSDATSPLSNRQLISDKEVAISLERLLDSVVVDVMAERSALQPQQINESNDDCLGINSLPNEIILEVFRYLTQNKLAQIARVCRRWKELTKDPLLWKNVNVKLFLSDSSRTTIAKSFINGLPSCVTSMRLEFVKGKIWNGALDFGELCMKLLGKCPHIEQLIVINSQMSNCLSSVISVCSRLLQDLKKLIFYHSTFRRDCSTDECLGTSKIKVLELNNCYLYSYHSECPFSRMPHLEQLHLYGATVPRFWFVAHTFFLSQLQVLNLRYTFIDSRIFTSIQNHGHGLKELYLCSTDLQDHALTFTESMLPHLKTICLSDTRVTCVGVVSFIQTCPSLLNVYVNRHVADTFAVHPFVAANRSKAEIVKAIFRNHSHSVDYLYN